MGDASMSQQSQMPDPNMEQPMEDPNMMGGPEMGGDPNMMGGPEMPQDPNMEQPMNDNGEQDASKEKKEIQKNIGKACADFRDYQGQDKEELGKWISGMLDSLDGEDDENTDFDDDSIEAPVEQEMPMESVVFKKKQLNKVNEIFGTDNLSTDNKPKNEKIKNNSVKNTPFNNPDYGK